MHYMLDTNICIYLIKLHPTQVLARLQTLVQGDVGRDLCEIARRA